MFPTGKIDLVEIITVLFTLFFFGLVLYLRREDRREGYPLEDDVTGRLESSGLLFVTAEPKTFLLHSGATVVAPSGRREARLFHAKRTGRAPGLPLEPIGDPLHAAVGPGAYAQRAKTPDLLLHGGAKIAPLRASPGFFVDPQGPDPVGMAVVGADGVQAGVVSDLWIDRAEYMVRYLEVALTGTASRVLVPMPMAVVSKARQTVTVNAVLGSQFAGAPALANPNQITFDEEERVAAYYGGGLLYATPARLEPYI
jgi:photosynthetic reaction center H subunit